MLCERLAFARGGLSEDGVDDARPDGVEEAEVGAGDHDEAQHDAGGLRDLLAIRPLHATELDHACAQEVDEAVAAAPADLGADGGLAPTPPGGLERGLLAGLFLVGRDLVRIDGAVVACYEVLGG